MKRWLWPLGLFVVLMVFLGLGLTRNPSEVPSPLIGKPAPAFRLPLLQYPDKTFTQADAAGKVWILNVWASWCAPCREEHPVWVDAARDKSLNLPLNLYGLNYKDKAADSQAWLARYGNPYTLSVADTQGRVGIDYGVYGVPETFIIDKQGIIRYKHIGPVTPEVLQQEIFPLLKRLNGNA